MKYRLFFAVLLTTALQPLATFGQEQAPAKNDKIVVMISVDGLAGFYIDDPKAEMPTIRQLASEGVRASSMKASVPTVTWPNHTTLVTGVYPARHGVVGNNYFDRASGERVVLIGDPVFDKVQIVKSSTIYDVAHAAGIKTAAIRWPASRNAPTIDWGVGDISTTGVMLKTSTSGLIDEAVQAGVLPEFAKSADGKPAASAKLDDDASTRLFDFILARHRPGLGLLHVASVDHEEHLFGPRSPEAYAAIKRADGQVREVWDTLKKEFPGKATLVVVSDHGFSKIERAILPNVVLRKQKLMNTVMKDGTTKPAVRIVPQGGSALVYILDQDRRDELIGKVKDAFKGIEGMESVAGPDETVKMGVGDPKNDPNAPDMILFGKMGNVFGDTAAGDLSFNEKPERKGSHGHNPNLPDLHATFVAWGRGIKAGENLGEIENIDVTPTLAQLLGLPMPGLDGKPIKALTGE